MRGWFGDDWGAPVCSATPHVPTPIGRGCPMCGALVRDGDRGVLLPYVGLPGDPPDVAYHLACFLYSVTGDGREDDEGGT